MKVYFSLGSDLGDRKNNIERALALMQEAFGAAPLKVSGFIETGAEGFEGPDFLNAATLFDIDLTPRETLRRIKEIESAMGREISAPRYDAQGRRVYSPRIIDIDILLFGDIEMNTPELQIPHPRMYGRDFVMIPLEEILSAEP